MHRPLNAPFFEKPLPKKGSLLFIFICISKRSCACYKHKMYAFSNEDSLMWTVLVWVNIKSFTLLGTLPNIFEKRLLSSSPLTYTGVMYQGMSMFAILKHKKL